MLGTDLCHADEVADDDGSLLGRGLAEHHELDPLGDAVEEGDEALQDGIIHRAAVHHKAVVVLELEDSKTMSKFPPDLQCAGVFETFIKY